MPLAKNMTLLINVARDYTSTTTTQLSSICGHVTFETK